MVIPEKLREVGLWHLTDYVWGEDDTGVRVIMLSYRRRIRTALEVILDVTATAAELADPPALRQRVIRELHDFDYQLGI